ncbi:hypothetical protein HK097_002956 [Rhizophlyctis rosea]|uniref:protein-tyrosine-phosphatase n=1 Tax=Rhizophlyctis rosea TaxID=64517 RepID=A0AAD5X0W1_9FUNG|nr:hypothetical protein HK097_002956 [Rhizophlyctis rosea]
MIEILPNLFIGTYTDAERLVIHPEESKWTVINCTREIRNISNRHSSQYKKIPLDDTGNLEDNMTLQQQVHPVLDFIDEKRKKEEPVLIHCQLGKSRSCSVVAAYLLHKDMVETVEEAKKCIIERHPKAFDGGELRVYDMALRQTFDVDM